MHPPTPGFTAKKSLTCLKYAMTPEQDRRLCRGLIRTQGTYYLKKLAHSRLSEETKIGAMLVQFPPDITKSEITLKGEDKVTKHKDSMKNEDAGGEGRETHNAPSSRVMTVKLISKLLMESSVESISSPKETVKDSKKEVNI